MELEVSVDGLAARKVTISRLGDGVVLWIDGRRYHGHLHGVGRGYEVHLEEEEERVWLCVEHDTVFIHAFGRSWKAEVVDPTERSLRDLDQDDVLSAPMPGSVVEVRVAPGDEVSEGQTLVVIESMKMQTYLSSSRDGVVDRVHLDVGSTFDRGAALVSLVPVEEEEEN